MMSLLSQRVLCIGVMVGCLVSATLCYGEPQVSPGALDCGYQSREQWHAAFEAAIARGEIARPTPSTLPVIAARQAAPAMAIAEPCLTPQQIFLFEDTSQVLLTNFSNGQLFNLMISAANAMLAAQGDNYDFVGYFVNFTPNHTLGAAFYLGWENDVQGIGSSLYNERAGYGIAGNNIEGFVMMWNINSSFWQPGTGSNANFARLVLGQEFEHRFAMFLPNLADGRSLQGDNAGCGRSAHWSWKVDGQGSGMEISDWVGSNPALPQGLNISFNADIPGSVFSYTDLYLMGYVSAAEMDAGNSELRFMNTSNCSSNYTGTITNFTSADIIATAGPRIPNAAGEDKDYRTGWIMIHLPGSPPTSGELNKAVGILQQHQTDWNVSTLGRGTMNNTLFADCNCNGVPDSTDIANGEPDIDFNGVPDICEVPAALVPPVLAAAPNDQPKQKYISIDASTNGPRPLAIKVTETTTGKVMWADAPFNGSDIDGISALTSTPFVTDWSTFSVLHLTGCIIQPFGVYEIAFVNDPLGVAETTTPLAASTTCIWGDVQVTPDTCDAGIGDITESININTLSPSAVYPRPHGDLQGDVMDGQLSVSDIVAAINSATTAAGTVPVGYTPLPSCP